MFRSHHTLVQLGLVSPNPAYDPSNMSSDPDSGASTPSGPLEGILVVDLATERAELAGRILADLGAEVIKIEPPAGARSRLRPPYRPGSGESLYWAAVALNKKSAVLDLRNPDGETFVPDDLVGETFCARRPRRGNIL